VVAAPADLETCVAYATQPGSTAQDGSGRNGVFTAAMLRNLGTPGASLSDLMTSVIADVKAATGGKQQPRVDIGLSRPFFFIDPALAAARAQAALLSGQKPDITETNAMFTARAAAERSDLDSRRGAELAELRATAGDRRIAQTREIRAQFDGTIRTLQAKTWISTGKNVSLRIGEFDRDSRLWPLTIESADPGLPFLPIALVADLNKASDPIASIRSLDAAVKAQALASPRELSLPATLKLAPGSYSIDAIWADGTHRGIPCVLGISERKSLTIDKSAEIKDSFFVSGELLGPLMVSLAGTEGVPGYFAFVMSSQASKPYVGDVDTGLYFRCESAGGWDWWHGTYMKAECDLELSLFARKNDNSNYTGTKAYYCKFQIIALRYFDQAGTTSISIRVPLYFLDFRFGGGGK